jgi:5-methylcytosine-specific restriction protein B
MPPVDLTAPAPSYWKIAPGEKAVNWPECHKGGYISMGYYELGDLKGLTQTQFDARRDELLRTDPGYAGRKPHGLNMVWKFSQIPVGSRIVANRGHYEVLGIGTVVRPYYYEESADFPHRLGVGWDDTTPRSVAFTYWNSTLIALNREDFLSIVEAPRSDGQVTPQPRPSAAPSTRERARRAPPLTFERITKALAGGGYHFPDELVAAYLLALQTKRFVILSGISGTGKTQLALQVGRAMTAARVAALGEDEPPIRITLTRNDLDSARIPLPAEVLLRFPRFAAAIERKDEVMLSTHADTREQSTMVDRRTPHRPILRLEGTAAAWLTSTYRPGQLVAIDIDEDVNPPSVFLLPASPADTARSVEVIAVRPDWSDNRGLLGFYNPLTQRYQSTPLLRLLLAARDELDHAGRQNRLPRPFFAILDEMNLARVEHYFSDFLSCLESGEPLHLHDDTRLASGDVDGAEPIPTHIEIPRNVFLTGTVNVDETTYMFSPKVLDRAFVFEFNSVDLAAYGRPALPNSTLLRLTRVLPDPFTFSGNPTPDDWTRLARFHQSESVRHPLQAIHEALRRDNRHFGFRVANEVARFLFLALDQAGEIALPVALDVAVLAKVLPKLHGTQQELAELLTRLFAICVDPEDPKSAPPMDQWDPLHDSIVARKPEQRPQRPRLPRSAGKLWRMHRRLIQQGFVSFIE